MNLKVVLTAIFLNACFFIQAQQANHLLDSAAVLAETDHDLSVSLYDRIAYFYQDDDSVALICNERSADLLLKSGKHKEAAAYYTRAAAIADADSTTTRLTLQVAFCYLLNRSYDQVLTLLDSATFLSGPPEDLYYQAAFYLGAAYELSGNYRAAEPYFALFYPLLAPADSIELYRLNQKMLHTGGRNKQAAFIMSLLVPGLGQTYSGHPGDGLNSLLLNGALVTASVFIGITYTLADGGLTFAMWVPRYYIGGARKARELASQKNNALAGKRFDAHLDFFTRAKLHLPDSGY